MIMYWCFRQQLKGQLSFLSSFNISNIQNGTYYNDQLRNQFILIFPLITPGIVKVPSK